MSDRPIYHHYLPRFYLKRWTDCELRLCRFSKPQETVDLVVPKRVSTKRTGGEDGLYELKGLPLEEAQRIETEFMKPLDTLASDALSMIEDGDSRINRESKYRSAWSRFLMSVMMRMPNDMAVLKEGLAEEWARHMPDLEVAYAEKRGVDDPATFAEYIATREKNEFERWAISVATTLIDHAGIGGLLNNMRWFVQNLKGEGEFLTCDQPILSWHEFKADDSYVMLPIGPKRLFVAVNNLETQRRIEARYPDEQVTGINRLIAGRALKYVYATSDTQLAFVTEHFGKYPRKSLFQKLVEFRRQKNAEESRKDETTPAAAPL